MTSIAFLKLGVAPLLILAVTLLARRFGPAVAGLAMGIPLLTGPISIFTALEQGTAFASHAAIGNLIGQVSTCMFCYVYATAARRYSAWCCAGLGLLAFFAATFIWSQFHWGLMGAALVFVAGLAVLHGIFPKMPSTPAARVSPWWELPARMVVAGCFVFLLTVASAKLGSQLSGLLAPFPVLVLVLVVFTHLHGGNGAAMAMTKGVLLGSPAFGGFFLAVALGLGQFPIVATYTGATLVCMAVSGSVLLWRQRNHIRIPLSASHADENATAGPSIVIVDGNQREQ